jgi:hypothetical protein
MGFGNSDNPGTFGMMLSIVGILLKNLRIAEVEKLDMKIEDGKIVGYRAKHFMTK